MWKLLRWVLRLLHLRTESEYQLMKAERDGAQKANDRLISELKREAERTLKVEQELRELRADTVMENWGKMPARYVVMEPEAIAAETMSYSGEIGENDIMNLKYKMAEYLARSLELEKYWKIRAYPDLFGRKRIRASIKIAAAIDRTY